MRYWLAIFWLGLGVGMVGAQDETVELTPYEIAQARIAEARDSGAIQLHISFLELTDLPLEIGTLTNLRKLYLHANELVGLLAEIGNFANLEFLYMDDTLWQQIPDAVAEQGTQAVVAYIRNQALWHIQRLLISGVLMVLVVVGVLWLLVRRRRLGRKAKPKHESFK